MIPKDGQHVKCILRNGAIAEGIVQEWYANEAILGSLDGESTIIITHPTEDIVLIKIMTDSPHEEKEEVSEAQKVADKIREKSLEEKFQELHANHDPNNSDDRKSLAELKIAMAEQERKIIAERLKDHRPTSMPRKVEYGIPGLGKKPRTK